MAELQNDNSSLRQMVEEDLGKAKCAAIATAAPASLIAHRDLCMRLREKNETFAASVCPNGESTRIFILVMLRHS